MNPKAHRSIESNPHNHRWNRRAWIGASIAVILAWTGGASSQASCGEMLPAPLVAFCPGTPARATDMNQNFRAVAGWIENKIGPVGSPDITVGGAATFTGTVTVPNGAFTGAELRDESVTNADVQDGSLRLADLDEHIVGTGLSASGSAIQVDPTWVQAQVSDYVRAHCHVRIGWRDGCDACRSAPSRMSPRLRADGTCESGSAGETYCNGAWTGVGTDGDVNDDDEFYVSLVCDPPTP